MYWLTWIWLDIDECVTTPGICQYNCTNIVGGYYCSCPTGYQLVNGHNCAGKPLKYWETRLIVLCFLPCTGCHT